MELDELYSTDTAYAYLLEKKHLISFGTFKSHIHTYKHISPIRFGADVEGGRPRALLFTRRMLDVYIAGERPCVPTASEQDAIIGADEAMAESGLKRRGLKQLPSRVIGGALVILRADAAKSGW